MTDTPTQVDINEAMEYAAGLKDCHDCWADRAAIALYDELTTITEQRDRLTEALQGLRRHAPIMGSAGDYRQGQLDVLKSVERISDEALQSLTPNEL